MLESSLIIEMPWEGGERVTVEALERLIESSEEMGETEILDMKPEDIAERILGDVINGDWRGVAKLAKFCSTSASSDNKAEMGLIKGLESLWREWKDSVTFKYNKKDDGVALPPRTTSSSTEDWCPDEVDDDDDVSDKDSDGDFEDDKNKDSYLFDIFTPLHALSSNTPPSTYFFHTTKTNGFLRRIIKLMACLEELRIDSKNVEFASLSAIALTPEMVTRGHFEDPEFDLLSGKVLLLSSKLAIRYNQNIVVNSIVTYTAVAIIGMTGELKRGFEGFQRLQFLKFSSNGEETREPIQRCTDWVYDVADKLGVLLEAFSFAASCPGGTLDELEGGITVALERGLLALYGVLRNRKVGKRKSVSHTQILRNGAGLEYGLLTRCLTAISVLGFKGRQIGLEVWNEFEGGESGNERSQEDPDTGNKTKTGLVKCCFKQLEKNNAVLMKERSGDFDDTASQSSQSSISAANSGTKWNKRAGECVELFPRITARLLSEMSSSLLDDGEEEEGSFYSEEVYYIGEEIGEAERGAKDGWSVATAKALYSLLT